ncbi:hypothetical protein SAMN05428984_0363 [Sphingomonas sp. OK281]|nr:hypothetical protein SAMN05428984_0363 [Sphingomonas sp. OK281]
MYAGLPGERVECGCRVRRLDVEDDAWRLSLRVGGNGYRHRHDGRRRQKLEHVIPASNRVSVQGWMSADKPPSTAKINFYARVRTIPPDGPAVARMPNELRSARRNSAGLVVAKLPPTRTRDSAGSPITILFGRYRFISATA